MKNVETKICSTKYFQFDKSLTMSLLSRKNTYSSTCKIKNENLNVFDNPKNTGIQLIRTMLNTFIVNLQLNILAKEKTIQN